MKTLYLIGGPMGVGKTAVCQALKHQLPNAVFLDGDWCWDADPFQVTGETKSMVLENIRFLLRQFLRCSAYENVIFCWVLHQPEIWNDILTTLDTTGCAVRRVKLLCSEDALRDRLSRDIALGIRQPDIIPRALAYLPLYAQIDAEAVDTSEKSVEAVVREILQPHK